MKIKNFATGLLVAGIMYSALTVSSAQGVQQKKKPGEPAICYNPQKNKMIITYPGGKIRLFKGELDKQIQERIEDALRQYEPLENIRLVLDDIELELDLSDLDEAMEQLEECLQELHDIQVIIPDISPLLEPLRDIAIENLPDIDVHIDKDLCLFDWDRQSIKNRKQRNMVY